MVPILWHCLYPLYSVLLLHLNVTIKTDLMYLSCSSPFIHAFLGNIYLISGYLHQLLEMREMRVLICTHNFTLVMIYCHANQMITRPILSYVTLHLIQLLSSSVIVSVNSSKTIQKCRFDILIFDWEAALLLLGWVFIDLSLLWALISRMHFSCNWAEHMSQQLGGHLLGQSCAWFLWRTLRAKSAQTWSGMRHILHADQKMLLLYCITLYF